MLEFKTPELVDGDWVRSIAESSDYMGSDAAFGTLFIWRLRYKFKICKYKDFIIKQCLTDNGELCYFYPMGHGDIKDAVDAVIAHAHDNQIKLQFISLTEDMKNQLDELYPGRFQFENVRDSADYIYSTEKLATLAGRKYHSKRNHISAFEQKHSVRYERITPENMHIALDICRSWCVENGCSENALDSEFCAIRETVNNYDELGFMGAIIYADGVPAAMTIGERINSKVFIIHFEKTTPEFKGAYPVINRDFVRNELMSYQLVNREEDMGIEGLRKAKLSYRPEILLEKYNGILLE